MRTVTAMDLRRRLGEILDAASAGERILVERDHRPLAYLVSVEDGQRLDGDREERIARRLAALDRLSALAQRMREEQGPLLPAGMTAAEWMRWDRDHRDDPDYYEQLERLRESDAER
jgi:prevent-host-death family protein